MEKIHRHLGGLIPFIHDPVLKMHLGQEFSISVDMDVRSILEAREIWNEKDVCEKGEAKMILIDNGGMGGFYREIYEGFADFLLVRLIRFKAIWSFENATRYVIWLKAWEALRPERSALITIIDVPRWRILFSNGGIRCTICSRLAIFRSFPCVYVVSWEREIFNKLILNIVKYCTHFNEHFLLYLFHPILCEKLLRIIRFDSTDHELFEVLLSLQKLR